MINDNVESFSFFLFFFPLPVEKSRRYIFPRLIRAVRLNKSIFKTKIFFFFFFFFSEIFYYQESNNEKSRWGSLYCAQHPINYIRFDIIYRENIKCPLFHLAKLLLTILNNITTWTNTNDHD